MTETHIRYAVAPLERVEVRDTSANGDNTWTMSGYAAVFDQQTTAFDNCFDRFTIDIDPKAFDNVLSSQNLDQPDGAVHFNFGHDMNRAIAATDVPAGQPGSLSLNADSYGWFGARPRDDPDGSPAAKMRSASSASVVRVHRSAWRRTWTSTETEAWFRGSSLNPRDHSLHDVCATRRECSSDGATADVRETSGQPFTGALKRQPDLGGASIGNSEEADAAEESPTEALLLSASDVLDKIRSDPQFGGMFRK